MEKVIRWGILGTGFVANDVAQCFSHVKSAQLHAVGSRTLESAKAFGSRHGIPHAYGSYAEMLADAELDVVYIATPHHRHREDCLQAFNAGKAVLCEKPFTMNASQAEDVIKAAGQKNIFCMEAMWMRFIPLIREIKRRIDAGEIGRIQMLKADFGYPVAYDPESRFFSLEQGGGSLMDRGVYTLSLAYYLMGRPEYFNSYAVLADTGVDAQSAYLLGYANGALASLSSTMTTYASNEALIMGDAGQIRIHDPFYRPSHISLSQFEPPKASSAKQSPDTGLKSKLKNHPLVSSLHRRLSPVLKTLRGGGNTISRPFPGSGYQYELEEVTQCLLQGKTESDVMPLADTLAIMQAMDAMREQWGLRYPKE